MPGLLTAIVAFAASSLGTRLFIDWLHARNLVAVENHRTMHTGAIPQGGGVPVVMAILATSLVMGAWTSDDWSIGSLALVLAILSGINDRVDLPPLVRLAVHAGAAMGAVALLPASVLILHGWLPWALDRLVVVLALVWFMNLYNFMDGIDGITGVETISITVGALIVGHVAGVPLDMDGLTLAILGASAGFLVWNWHKARIFLGDVGSIPLGFLAGFILLKLAASTSLAAALILPLYYLTDATLTLVRRLLRGEKVWEAHREHAYQRAARAVGSHAAIALRIAACNSVLIVLAVVALSLPMLAFAMAALTVATLMAHLEAIASRAKT